MGSTELAGIVDNLGDLLGILTGLLKGDLTQLSTEGSVAGIFGSTGDVNLVGSIVDSGDAVEATD